MYYFDAEGNVVYLFAPIVVQPLDAQVNTPLGLLLDVACGAAPVLEVRGNYAGMNTTTYKKGGQGEQKITIVVEQIGSTVNMKFQTPPGGQGKGVGTLVGAKVESVSLQSTAPECPGSYQASLSFVGDDMSWSYKGEDCGGPMEGHGTAKRTKE
jgi:hypothetical protein